MAAAASAFTAATSDIEEQNSTNVMSKYGYYSLTQVNYKRASGKSRYFVYLRNDNTEVKVSTVVEHRNDPLQLSRFPDSIYVGQLVRWVGTYDQNGRRV